MTLLLNKTDIVLSFEAFNYPTKKHTQKNDHKALHDIMFFSELWYRKKLHNTRLKNLCLIKLIYFTYQTFLVIS